MSWTCWLAYGILCIFWWQHGLRISALEKRTGGGDEYDQG